MQGVLFDAGQQLLLATNNHTSVIKAGEKPKNKYKEAAEVDGWGEVMIDCTAAGILISILLTSRVLES